MCTFVLANRNAESAVVLLTRQYLTAPFAELPHTDESLVALVKIALNTKFNLIYFDFSEMHVDLNGYFNPVM